MTRADFWKTYRNMIGTHTKLMDEFPIGPAHVPEIKISKKYLKSFPEIRLCHNSGKLKFQKIVWMNLPGFASKG